MKIGSQHRTAAIGTDSEHFFGSLTGLFNNPNGTYRPDFVTRDKVYSPRLSIELKSGRNRKGVLCDYQLRYATTVQEDYGTLFGDIIPPEDIAYYNGLICRAPEAEDILAEELEKPFSTIRLSWGDQYIIPGDMSFYIFVIGKVMRDVWRYKRNNPGSSPSPDNRMGHAIEEYRAVARGEIDESEGSYSSQKSSKSWQSLNGRDLDAIIRGDLTLASRDGRERVRLLQKYYPGFEDLHTLKIPSTEGHSIYVLAKEEHRDLFDKQLRPVVEERVPQMEQLIEERRATVPLLEEIVLIEEEVPFERDFFSDGPLEPCFEEFYSLNNLSRKEVDLLHRLSRWLPAETTSVVPPLDEYGEIKDSYEGPGVPIERYEPDELDDEVPF